MLDSDCANKFSHRVSNKLFKNETSAYEEKHCWLLALAVVGCSIMMITQASPTWILIKVAYLVVSDGIGLFSKPELKSMETLSQQNALWSWFGKWIGQALKQTMMTKLVLGHMLVLKFRGKNFIVQHRSRAHHTQKPKVLLP